MRVTNLMQHNMSITNINRNQRHLLRLTNQASSGKAIDKPAEDPLIASRALRFRTRLAGIEQHQNNVASAHAWMEVTESVLFNLVRGPESIFGDIKDLLVSSDGSYNLDNRLANFTEIRGLMEQIGAEMNQTYEGRFVFSGWRTHIPPVLTANETVTHNISQTFSASDIESTKAFHRIGADMPLLHDVNILKLPYAEDGSGRTVSNATVTIGGVNFPVTQRRFAVNPDNFQPGPNQIYFAIERGELMLGANALAAMQAGGDLTIAYQVSNLRIGDLNPRVFFDARDAAAEMDHRINFEFSPGTLIHVNVQGKDVFTAEMFSDLRNLLDFANSIVPPDRRVIEQHFLDDATYNFMPGSSELAARVEERVVAETQMIMQALNHRVNNMLSLMDGHIDNAIGRHTELGARMARLDSLYITLDEDHTNLTTLKSDNEDVDFFDVLERFRIMERAHEGALQVIANNIQLSLLGFI